MTNHKFWGIIKFHDHWCPPSLGHVTDGQTLIMLAPHMSIKVIVTIKIMSHTSQLNSSSSCRWLMWAWNVLSRYNYLLHYRGHRQQNKLFNCDMYEQHFDNSDNSWQGPEVETTSSPIRRTKHVLQELNVHHLLLHRYSSKKTREFSRKTYQKYY